MIEIYGLFDPRTDELRYIGKAKIAKKRFKGHLRDATRRRTPVYDWIGSLAKAGLIPLLKVLSTVPEDGWEHEEKRLIFEHRLPGSRLLNIADGGNAPKCSNKVCSKNAKILNAKCASSPQQEFVRNAKRAFAQAIREGRLPNRIRASMRYCAAKRPDLFGCWKNTLDRIEEAA